LSMQRQAGFSLNVMTFFGVQGPNNLNMGCIPGS